MKTKVIAFSGACNSGKTFTITRLAEDLKFAGHSVCVVDEIIRRHKIESIDKLRFNAHNYLELQLDVIPQKIKQELQSQKSNDYEYIFFDRSIVDSLFYLLFYVDKARLSNADFKRYIKLYKKVIKHVESAFEEIYDKVILFEPFIDIIKQDSYRPERVLDLSVIEYDMIKLMTEQYAAQSQIIYHNAMVNNYKELYLKIL